MKELRKTVEALVSIAAVAVWISAENQSDAEMRIWTGIACLFVAFYWGWQLSLRVVRYERIDRGLIALFGERLLELGGTERLRRCFQEFLKKPESENWIGRSTLCLSNDISIEFGNLMREKETPKQGSPVG